MRPIVPARSLCYWIGGTADAETQWGHPANWSSGRVPDENDEVIIPSFSDTAGFFPIIYNNALPVKMLTLDSGAELTIEKDGKLSLLYLGDKALSLYYAKLINRGTLDLSSEAEDPIQLVESQFSNFGTILIGSQYPDPILQDGLSIFQNDGELFFTNQRQPQ